jgi:hypothetical protein
MKKIISLTFAITCIWNLNSQDTLILFPTQDAPIGYHDNWSDGSANDGGGSHFPAYVIPGTSGGVNLIRSVIQYDLSVIPVGTELISAKLEFYAFNNYPASSFLSVGHRGNNEVYLKKMTSSWSEYQVNWLNKPATSDENQIIIATSDSVNQNYLEIDATEMIQFFIDNPTLNFGMQMGLVSETLGNAKSFYSRNSSDITKRPRLVLEYKPSATSAPELQDIDFTLFPNPSKEIIEIKLGNVLENYSISIYDLEGKKIKNIDNLIGNQTSLNISDFKKGFYYVEIKQGNNRIRKKLLVD